MAFNDDAATPRSRKLLFIGIALFLTALVTGPLLMGIGLWPRGEPVPLLLRVLNLILLFSAFWSLVVHFRGPGRRFSPRERRYWWSYAIPVVFCVPLAIYIVQVQNRLAGASGLRGEDRREAMIAALTQPVASWFAALIALSLGIGFVWSMVVYFRNADELEVQANLWASTWALLAMLIGAPVWHFLALGGLLPPISLVPLLAIGFGVLAAVFVKIRFF